jgi:16S rRNA (uracil1498-N3)-methyltransferase
MARFYCPLPLAPGLVLDLPPTAARHVQVLRLQPGGRITLFNGEGGEFVAEVEHMGRSDVRVRVQEHHAVEREAPRAVHLAMGMPANDRMDWLVEKAAELGVASIQPLMTERSVLRLTGERAEKKVAHWQSVAVAACEQCGGNRVPQVHAVMGYGAWLKARAQQPVSGGADVALLLSLHASTRSLPVALALAAPEASLTFLSGPEGGLSAAEEGLALAGGFSAVTLGPRVLRSETAALAALAALTALATA